MVTRAFSLVVVLAGIASCSSRTTEPPRAEIAVAGEVASASPAAGCDTARCWIALAEAAEQRGADDVGAAHRGRAHLAEPTPERLHAWIEALIVSGGRRRAQAALVDVDEATRAQFEARLASLPASPPAAPRWPLSDRLRLAYAARVARPDEAVRDFAQALAEDPDPVHLAHMGELQWSRDEQVEARRLWSRARTRLHELGATVEVVPVETWYTGQALWRGDALVLVRQFRPKDYTAAPAGALDTLRVMSDPAVTGRLRLAGPVGLVALSDDGETLVRDDEGALVLQDMSSGAIMRRFPAQPSPARALAVVGSGAAMLVLAGHGAETILWNAQGEQLRRFTLHGTTPTITRVYTGEGAYHNNILRDDPTWAVALAMTADASMVAIGGSDAKVRLFDNRREDARELAFDWHYKERRLMGGNPDSNHPLALRFVDGGAELVAVHAHGDLLRWDTRKGVARKRLRGTCSAAEAEQVVNRYRTAGEPRRAATAEEREGCGHARAAALSADASQVATGGVGQGVRVRDARTGAPGGLYVGDGLPDQHLALASSGALALVDAHGQVMVVPAGQTSPQPRVAGAAMGPSAPAITPGGRYLHFVLGGRSHLWDLIARRRIELTADPNEQVLALAPNGAHVAIYQGIGMGIEIREVSTGAALARVPLGPDSFRCRAQFTSTSGHVLIDRGGDRARVLFALPGGAEVPLPPAQVGQALLSDDARWLATWSGPLKIWSVATGELVATLDDHVRHVAFARDGSFVVALRQTDPRRSGGSAHLHWLDRQDRSHSPELRFDGFPDQSEISPDGDEVLIALEGRRLLRWRPQAGTHTEINDIALAAIQDLQITPDGDKLLITGHDRVVIRRNDAALTPLATLHPLVSGGWLARSAAGAVDGSDDAADELLARVHGLGEGPVAVPSQAVWDGLHVEGLLARALSGEAVAPPLQLGPH